MNDSGHPLGEEIFRIDWKNPDYRPILRARQEMLTRLRRDRGLLLAVKEFYKDDHYVEFIRDWGMTRDPRVAAEGRNPIFPLIPFPRQVELLHFFHRMVINKTRGVVDKTRDCGASWMALSYAIWRFIFHPYNDIGFGSRKEELVDSKKDPKALFPKGRDFIRLLPREFRPEGWDERRHSPYMKFINPENGSTIIGEAGDNIGRGGRTLLYFVDEAQPYNAKILTPTGWRNMGDLSQGDFVISGNGVPTEVLGINKCGKTKVYRLWFSDGTYADCSPNHKWVVDYGIDKWKRKRKVVRAKEIASNYAYRSPKGQTHYKYRLPPQPIVDYGINPILPIDPYLLGVLLGDGCLTKTSLTIATNDQQIIEEIRKALPEGYTIKHSTKYNYYIIKGPRARGKVKGLLWEILEEYGLRGLVSHEKFIPEDYIFASKDDRIALLQGLMDTDGSASGGSITFHSQSKMLAEGVLTIARSLGAMATLKIKPDHRGYRPQYLVYMRFDNGIIPFRLKRKAEKIKKRGYHWRKTIVNVEVLPETEVQCIQVADKSGTYITNGFAITHNSAFLERPALVDAALSENTNTQIDISTHNGVGTLFYKKTISYPRDRVFEFDWRDDPRKDEEWYLRKKNDPATDPVIFAQEVERDPSRSVGDSFIPVELLDDAMQRKPEETIASGPWIVSVDVAAQGNDKSIVNIRRGSVNFEQKKFARLEGDQLAAEVERICDKLLLEKVAPLGAIIYELAGPGYGFHVAMKSGRYRKALRPVHPGRKLDSQEFYNERARFWALAKEWLEEGFKSMAPDRALKMQASALRYNYKSVGSKRLLLIESKEEYRARMALDPKNKSSGPSPDEADAWAMSFAPVRMANIRSIPSIEGEEDLQFSTFVPFDSVVGY